MIILQEYFIENFQSIKELSVKLDTNKVYCVIGKNGSGKSSMFEGLLWVLYGKARTKNFIRHKSSYCFGKVKLSVNGKEIIISRYKNHPELGNSVRLTIEGEDLVLHTLKEANERIEELIGSYELFQSCVILTQGLPYDFTNLTPTVRKVVFEELIGIGYWDKLKDKTQKKLKDIQYNLNQILAEISTLENKQNYLQGKLEEIENQMEFNSISKELSNLTQTKDRLEKELTDFSEEVNITLIQDKLNRVIKKLSLLENEYKEKFSILESGVCPTCNQPYPESLINSVKERLNILKQNIVQLKQLKNQLESQREIAFKRENLFTQYKTISNRIKSLKEALRKSKRNIEDKLGEITKELELIQVELRNLQKTQEELESDIEFLNYILNLLKPSSQFRTNLLNKYVEVLNNILTEFPIEFSIKFELGKGLNLRINKDSQELELKQLSGGERRKVSIVILLALQQLMEKIGGIKANLLVVDEIFDSLDFDNLQFAVEMFSGFEGEKSIFIITHNEILKEMVSNIIEVEKVENISEYYNLPT